MTKEQLNRRGLTEAIYQAYVPGQNNYGAEIDELQAADIAVAFIGGYHTEIALMARAARDRGYPVQLMAGLTLATEDFGLIAGPAAEGTLFIDNPDPRRNAEAAPVVERFRASGFEPEGTTLNAYGAVQVWAQAAEKAGSLELQAMIASLREPPVRHRAGPDRLRREGRRHRCKARYCMSGTRTAAACSSRAGPRNRPAERALSPSKETSERGRIASLKGPAGWRERRFCERLGVRGRLLLAFLGISAFAVIAAAAAMYSFAEVGKVLGRITQERVPSALASLELSRQAERIVTAAPAFLAATTRAQHQETSQDIAAEVGRLNELTGKLKGSAVAPEAMAAVAPAIDGLQRNLTALDALVASRLDVAERKEQLLRKLSGTNIATQRLVAPGVLVMDSKLAEWRRALATAGLDEDARRAAASQLADEITVFMPQQKAQIELSAINDTLIKAAGADTLADLPLLAFPLRRSLATLEALASEFDDKLRLRLLERVDEFRNFMDGPDSIIAARDEELSIVGQAQGLLAENVGLSRQVGDALDRLVGAVNQDIGAANREALGAQRLGSAVLIGMVLLSLLSSGLIVWRYVDRNLVARLRALSDSMLAIAGGNLRAPLPAAGRDELGRMADALTVFRDTAVEVREKNLRELYALLETIDYGVLMLEPDLRVRIHNRAYRQMWDMPRRADGAEAILPRDPRVQPPSGHLRRAR